ncbi:MAG: hypothetical protein ABI565_01070 [Vicinamibacteria bacterium]
MSPQGNRVSRFLQKLGLNEDIAFESLDPDGYDHVILPDRQRVAIIGNAALREWRLNRRSRWTHLR